MWNRIPRNHAVVGTALIAGIPLLLQASPSVGAEAERVDLTQRVERLERQLRQMETQSAPWTEAAAARRARSARRQVSENPYPWQRRMLEGH